MPFSSILADKICTVINCLYATRKTYYKSATSDEYVLVIRKESRARIPNLAIVSKAKDRPFKQLTGGFCSDSDTCIMVSGDKGDNGLRVADDMCYIINNSNNNHEKWLYNPQERLTIKVPPVMSVFEALAKRDEPESRIW
jgi:hypothetical protein